MSTDGFSALRRPELARVWSAARDRLERNGGVIAGSRVRIADPTPAERDAIAGLLGRPRVAGGPITIRLDALDRALRSGAAQAGLVEVVEALAGPLRDRRRERDDAQARTEQMWAEARSHPAVAGEPRLGDWLDRARRSGVATRAASGSDPAVLLTCALDVLRELPADGIQLGGLAAGVTGDSHALDRHQPLGSLVVNALCFLADQPIPGSAGQWRRAWADAGVVCDSLSCDLLMLNLPLLGSGLVAETARAHAAVGQPLRCTLRQLAGAALSLTAGTEVFVCENPVVVAHAADALGAGCAPLICVDGVPNTAARRLLEALVACGARLRYHGDFDWGGLRIANIVIGAIGATPWRFRAADYEAAVRCAPRPGVALSGRPERASWDTDLAAAMRAGGVAIFEEQLLDELCQDLTLRACQGT